MNQARLLRIAQRMHPLLLHELQHGIDVRRMLVDARYARDVLLVCDALREHDLASLAQHFRAEAAGAAAHAAAAPEASGSPISGQPSRGPVDPAAAALPAARQPPARRWFGAGWRADR